MGKRIGAKKCYAVLLDEKPISTENDIHAVLFKGSGLCLNVDRLNQRELIIQWDATVLPSIYPDYKLDIEKIFNVYEGQNIKWKLNIVRLAEIISKQEGLQKEMDMDIKNIIDYVK